MESILPPPRRIAPAPPPRQHLHTFSDGSILRKMPARDLVKIRVWHGNRILNEDHKQSIAKSLKHGVKSLDMKPFHIVSYPVEDDEQYEEIQYFIVDGQHRHSILKENPEQLDFDVLVIEKKCESESEVIEYFKVLNHTRAIEWKEDPRILANRFIAALEKTFNHGKDKKIRPKATQRPYMYVENLREELMKRKVGHTGQTPDEFALFAKNKNDELLELFKTMPDPEKMIQKAIAIDFCLALDTKFKWLDDF